VLVVSGTCASESPCLPRPPSGIKLREGCRRFPSLRPEADAPSQPECLRFAFMNSWGQSLR
jgi:hypothetical protein